MSGSLGVGARYAAITMEAEDGFAVEVMLLAWLRWAGGLKMQPRLE